MSNIPPPQNAPDWLCGAGFTLRIWAAVVNEASFGSSMCLLGMAMPLLPPPAQGIAGMSGMPLQSCSWPASAPSWNSRVVFNYSPTARFVNWAPSAFPPLDSKGSQWRHCTSVSVDRDQQVGMALVHSFVPGAGSSISWRSSMAGGPPVSAGKGRTGKEGTRKMGMCRKRLSAASCPGGCKGCFVSVSWGAGKGPSRTDHPCIPPGWG